MEETEFMAEILTYMSNNKLHWNANNFSFKNSINRLKNVLKNNNKIK